MGIPKGMNDGDPEGNVGCGFRRKCLMGMPKKMFDDGKETGKKEVFLAVQAYGQGVGMEGIVPRSRGGEQIKKEMFLTVRECGQGFVEGRE
jgi:hypothetical protein